MVSAIARRYRAGASGGCGAPLSGLLLRRRRCRSWIWPRLSRASSQDIDPGFSIPGPSKDIDRGFAVPAPSGDIDPGFAWAQVGPNRWRSVRTDEQSASPSLTATSFDDNAAPTDGVLRSSVSYRPPAAAPSLHNGFRQAAGTQPAPSSQIDPSRTPVFQTGPDGKLHPVPGWHTTGPFDFGAWSHDIHWGGVAKDLTEIGAGVASVLSGVGLGRELLSSLGPEAETAVAEGIAESPAAKAAAQAIHGHHPNRCTWAARRIRNACGSWMSCIAGFTVC